jgi:hypothetical protein
VFKYHAMKTCRRVKVQLHALFEVNGQLHVPAVLHSEKEPPVPICYEARTGLDAVAKRRKIPAPTGNQTLVVQFVVQSVE